MTISDQAQNSQNTQARETALQQVSPAVNLVAPSVSYSAGGKVLVMGPEHRIRLAVDLFSSDSALTCLVTEALPESISAEIEQAAKLAESQSQKLFHFPLKAVKGYLGQYLIQVDINGQAANLAELVTDAKRFDTVLDLNTESHIASELKPAGYFHIAPVQGMDDLQAAVEDLSHLRGDFEKPRYIQVNGDLCAHSRNGNTGCTRCLDVCPADAIDVVNGNINVDAHLCHGAGGCATACPTSAIRYGHPQPQLLQQQCKQLIERYLQAGGDSPQLLIHDAEVGLDWIEKHLAELPGHWLPLQVEEMGAAGLDTWLSALAWGAGQVTLLTHDAVPQSITQALVSEVEVANRLLNGLAMGNRVAISSLSESAQWLQQQNPIHWPEAGLNAGEDKRTQISKVMSYLYQHADSKQLGEAVELPKAAAYGAVVIEEDDCTLCMSCVSTCPSKALISASDTPELSFNEDNCVQCGLCEQACPEKIISLQPRYLLDPEQRRNPRVLKEEDPFCCTSCGKPFATKGMVKTMLKRLSGHSMFGGDALKRLEMCEDCRVVDMVVNDPQSELYHQARGQEPLPGNINLIAEAEPNPKKMAQPINGAELIASSAELENAGQGGES
ncbi:MAG: 4Fe-4S binding protein [Motiliproteus sp.]|nr:4Fe-4S binding protein [Motiliproteus sp.]MCW9052914.1 4Fe-4S binding protein [Motiliproteus sp.]